MARFLFSLVIPAYNEARRLPPFLSAARDYLPTRYGDAYEVIVVDDGSTDDLAATLESWLADWPQLRVIHHTTNQGKGSAVCTGMLAAQGLVVLFADADGAAPIEEEARLSDELDDGADVAIGSRLVAGADAERTRTWTRRLIGRLFAALATRLLRLPVHDTQCGFKMFRHDVSRCLFERVREPGYLFDLELLTLAHRLGHRIAEVPIRWHDVAGSHLRFSRDFPHLLADLWRLRQRLAKTGKMGTTKDTNYAKK